MNVINRSDAGGKYISSAKGDITIPNTHLLHPIAYNKEIAELAAQLKRKYRDVFLEVINTEVDGDK